MRRGTAIPVAIAITVALCGAAVLMLAAWSDPSHASASHAGPAIPCQLCRQIEITVPFQSVPGP
jgi:hypothetical protein